jgi:nitrite reductase (NO-forming)
MKALIIWLIVGLLITLLAFGMVGCRPKSVQGESLPQSSPIMTATAIATVPGLPTKAVPTARVEPPATDLEAIASANPAEVAVTETIEFTLQTAVTKGKMVYIGVGGSIEGLVNPDLEVRTGATVQVTLVNGDGMQHDVSLPDFGATSELVRGRGDSTEIAFEVNSDQSGTFAYFCTVPGHRQAGQEGRLIVSGQ